MACSEAKPGMVLACVNMPGLCHPATPASALQVGSVYSSFCKTSNRIAPNRRHWTCWQAERVLLFADRHKCCGTRRSAAGVLQPNNEYSAETDRRQGWTVTEHYLMYICLPAL